LTYPPAIQETIAQHDACIWALGISGAAGMSEAEYTEITVGYFNSFLDVLKERPPALRRVHFELSTSVEKVPTRQRSAAFCTGVLRCESTPTVNLVELMSRLL
jgi:hypothetical protein